MLASPALPADWLPLTAALAACALAGAVWQLLRTLAVPHARLSLAAALAVPVATLATGLIDARDVFGAAACLLALDAALRRRHAAMLLWCGVGLAIASAALLFVPFVAAVLIHRRVHPGLLPLAALGYAATMPLGSQPVIALPTLTGSAPGVWSVIAVLLPAQAPRLVGLAIAAGLGASACFVAHHAARLPSGVRLLPSALIATLLTGGLLPQIPAGAFLLSATIAAISAAATRDRRAGHVALLLQTGLVFALAGQPVAGFVVVAGAIWLIAVLPTRRAANDNPIMMMPALHHPGF